MQLTDTEVHEPVTVRVVRIIGRVNLGNAQELEQWANQALAAGADRVLIDLSGTESLTSAGLRAILYIYKLFDGGSGGAGAGRSGFLKLAGPNPQLEKVIEIAGFTRFIEIHPDVETALRNFS